MPFEPTALVPMRKALAVSWNWNRSIRLIATEAGLPLERIHFDDTPELIWAAVLEEANNQGDQALVRLCEACAGRGARWMDAPGVAELLSTLPGWDQVDLRHLKWRRVRHAGLPIVAAAALMAGPGLLGLGHVALRARERLIGLEQLDYALSTRWLTGFDALYALPGSLFKAFSSGEGHLTAAAALLALVLAGVLFALPRLAPRARVVLLCILFPALLFAAGLQLATIDVARVLNPSGADLIPARLEESAWQRFSRQRSALPFPDLFSERARETFSWLTNDSPHNDLKRRSLAGLHLWLLAVIAAAALITRRTPPITGRAERLRRTLEVAWGLLFLLSALEVPRSHAIGAWGVKGLEVRRLLPACHPGLAAALEAGDCYVWLLSSDAEQGWVRTGGGGCPAGTRTGLVQLTVPDENPLGCVLEAGPLEVAWGKG